jgi:hypothetical protein
MNKPVDYLFESYHPGGTYSSLLPSVESREEIFALCAKLGIPNLVEADEYHCTLIYSKKDCTDIAKEDFNLPCSAIPVGFKILGTESKVLVLEVYCPNATFLHNMFMEKHGATHDYPDYIPHITIAKDYQGEPPTEVPEIQIDFTGFTIEELS